MVIPVKRLSAAKSRLRGALPGVPHGALALALAQDTIAAAGRAAGVVEVLVVTDDPAVAAAAHALGAGVVADRPRGATADPPSAEGLNAAVAHGMGLLAGPQRWVAALTADLPALRPAELAAALRAAADQPLRRFVADAPGTGTTLLTTPPGAPPRPRFGAGSAAAHAATGAAPLAGEWPSLRRDVDTAADLAAAAALGVGPHTAALVPDMAGPKGGSVRPMQGTVATYDPQTRSGMLLLDDGSELAFPTAAFDASGLRLLRLGQRVRIDHDDSGGVIRVTLPTIS